MSSRAQPFTPEQQDDAYMPMAEVLEADAQEGYDDRLLYHPWPHAESVHDKSVEYRDLMIAAGIPNVPSLITTKLKAWFHDYGVWDYWEDVRNGGSPYAFPEALSIAESAKKLRRRGVDDTSIEEVGDGIMGTKVGEICDSWGRLLLCAPDMFNTGSEYETEFRPSTEAFRQESEITQAKIIDKVAFDLGTLGIVGRYYFENLNVPQLLSQFDPIRRQREQMGDNLRRLSLETARTVGEDAVMTFLRNMKASSQILRLCRSGETEN